MTFQELESQVMQLSPQEREALAVRMLDSLSEPTGQMIDPEWLEEIERRYADYKAGKTQGIPASAVFARIRERHGWR